jgi:hypothetical protein
MVKAIMIPMILSAENLLIRDQKLDKDLSELGAVETQNNLNGRFRKVH